MQVWARRFYHDPQSSDLPARSDDVPRWQAIRCGSRRAQHRLAHAAGLGARSIGWPMPSTVAGHIRTRLWGERKFPGNEDKLRAISQIGPFFASQDEKYQWDLSFTAPADAAIYGRKAAFEIVPLRPTRTAFRGAACDLPVGLSPLAGARSEKETDSAPGFWTREQTPAWLKKTDPP